MKLKVAVIFGGESVEHDISIISASQAMNALDKNKYDIIPVYMTKNRNLYTGESLLKIENFKDIPSLLNNSIQITFINKNNQVFIESVKKGFLTKTISNIDVVIPVVHGTNGEDGVLQGYLEMLKVPYSSSDVVASAVGQDKVVMKSVLQNQNIKMAEWFWIYSFEAQENKKEIKEKALEIGYPLILKPACLGSSIGIEIANNFEELLEKIEECGKYDNKIVIEKKLENFIEVNCSVLGSIQNCQASVVEQVGQNNFLGFEKKYLGNAKGSKGMASTSRIIPAPISKKLEKDIKDLAIKTFKTVGANGVCRIDFMINENNEILVNEINNIPGSLSFYLWKPTGIEFRELMDQLVELALNRASKKEKMITSFDSSVLQGFSGTKGKLGTKN